MQQAYLSTPLVEEDDDVLVEDPPVVEELDVVVH